MMQLLTSATFLSPLLFVIAVLAQGSERGVEHGTLAQQFRLAAINTALPNANKTGAPLVLGAGGERSPLQPLSLF